MRNIAEFRIIGRVGRTEVLEKVAYINVAANYGRKIGGQWEDETHWNRVTVFGKSMERVEALGRGDLVHIVGRVRQAQYEREGQTVYSVDLIADGFATLSQHGDPADSGRDD